MLKVSKFSLKIKLFLKSLLTGQSVEMMYRSVQLYRCLRVIGRNIMMTTNFGNKTRDYIEGWKRPNLLSIVQNLNKIENRPKNISTQSPSLGGEV